MINNLQLRSKFKGERRLLGIVTTVQEKPEFPQEEQKYVYSASMVIGSIVLAGFLMFFGCITSKPAHAISLEESK